MLTPTQAVEVVIKTTSSDDVEGLSRSLHYMGTDPLHFRTHGMDLLSLAIRHNARHCISLLKVRGFSMDRISEVEKKHPLEEALDAKAIVAFEMLLKAGANPNAPHTRYGTIMHAAAAARLLDSVLPCLYTKQGDPNISDEEGLRPLHVAVKENQPLNMMQLLDRGAFVNAQDKHGRTALHVAVKLKEYDPGVGILLDYGADPHVPDMQGITPIKLAEETGEAGLIKEFAEYEAWETIFAVTITGKKHLFRGSNELREECLAAIRTGKRKNLVAVLESKSIQPWSTAKKSTASPLVTAIQKKRFDFAAILLACSLGITDTDESDNNIVHLILSTTKERHIITPFLKYIRRINPPAFIKQNSYKKTPYQVALESNLEHDISYLTELFTALEIPL